MDKTPTQTELQLGAVVLSPPKHWYNTNDLQIALKRLSRYESALRLIATPMRPDGTWNRTREACRILAQKALDTNE